MYTHLVMSYFMYMHVYIHSSYIHTDRHTDIRHRQTQTPGTDTDTDTNRQTDRQTDRINTCVLIDLRCYMRFLTFFLLLCFFDVVAQLKEGIESKPVVKNV